MDKITHTHRKTWIEEHTNGQTPILREKWYNFAEQRKYFR